MLARTADARATRDIDLLSEKADIDEALAELAAIDLVFDRIAYGKSEVVEPADRIDVPDIPTFGYRIYPATSSLADKLCAMVEMHDGRPSSRVKDLVDVAVYAVTTDFDGGELCRRARIEATVRGIKLPEKYAAPMEWKRLYRSIFRKLVRQTGLPPEYAEIETAEALAASLLDPILSQGAAGTTKIWAGSNAQRTCAVASGLLLYCSGIPDSGACASGRHVNGGSQWHLTISGTTSSSRPRKGAAWRR